MCSNSTVTTRYPEFYIATKIVGSRKQSERPTLPRETLLDVAPSSNYARPPEEKLLTETGLAVAKKKQSRKSSRTATTSRKTPTKAAKLDGPQRLNKVLAAAGLGSRREVEELIVQGRVEVDREVVTDLACKVDPKAATIKVDGQNVKKFRPVYFALNKPKGVLSTNRDPSGRMRVVDLVPNSERVFSVGRLDKSSEGLMLLTNDGELAQRLAHPKYRVQKSYFVVVSGVMSTEELEKLRKGVYLAEGFARIDGAKITKHRKGCTEVEIVLSEGKNREIRRILARAGHKVVVLKRTAIGPLRLGQLPAGASRELTPNEVKALYAVSSSSVSRKGSTRKKSTRRPAARKAGTEPERIFGTEDDEQVFFSDVSPTPGVDDEALGIGDDEFNDFDDDQFDDDFVGGFGGDGLEGSVLAYDEEEPLAKPSSNRGESRGRESRGRGPRRGGKATGQNRKTGNVRSSSSRRKVAAVKRGSSAASAAPASASSSAKRGGNPKRGVRKASSKTAAAAGGRPSDRPSSRQSGRRGATKKVGRRNSGGKHRGR